MSFGISINLSTAAMEEIYERLCWIYITVKNTLVYDHVGNTYHLSELTELSEGRIPYPEQFANKLARDYEQKSLLQDLQMIDILRTNWIKQGEEFLQQNFPDFLRIIPAANCITSSKIWIILDKIFVPTHVQPHALSQFSNFISMQSSFKMCLPLTEFWL